MGRTQGVRGAPRWADDLLIKIPQQGGSIVEEAQLVDQLGGLNTVALSWGQAVWATPCPGEVMRHHRGIGVAQMQQSVGARGKTHHNIWV